MRRYPAASSRSTAAARSASESWIPIDTPDVIREDVPCRLVGFRAVVRIALRHALAEAGRVAAVGAHQNEMFVGDAAKTRLEEVNERELQQTELQAVDPHCAMISSGRRAVP